MNPPLPSIQRRALAASLVFGPSLLIQTWAQAPRPLTPRQTEGPFYPVAMPADNDNDLLSNGSLRYAGGKPVWLSGEVTDPDGRPVRGARVEIWQCDEHGHYHHPGDGDLADKAFQGFGQMGVDAEGRYRFRTIEPVPYSGRTPHIHVKVKLGKRELLTTQLYIAGHAGNERDYLWRQLDERQRAALSVPFRAGEARFPLVVQA